MTYNQFINKVKSGLLYDQDNPDDESNSFIEQLIRDWMADLQCYIDNYKKANEYKVFRAGMSIKCGGGVITLPADMSSLVEVAFVKPAPDEGEDPEDCEAVRILDPISWTRRDELLEKDDCSNIYKFQYAIDPRAETMIVNPPPSDDEDDANLNEFIRIRWEGIKTEYGGSDNIPFGHDAIKCCSDYVNADLARKKEDKLSRYNSFIESFLMGRTRLFQNQRDKSQPAFGR